METDNKEVKEFIEKSEVTPSGDAELINEENETQSESSQIETKAETEIDAEAENEVVENQPEEQKTEEIKDVLGENPQARALRMEVTRVKRELAKYRKDELFTPAPKQQPVQNKVLENYDSEQVKELKMILAAAADELGFVKKDELNATINGNSRDEIWNSFLEKHPEYLVENDGEGAFYNQLKEEFGLYKEPTSAKDFQKLLNRCHDSIFGTKSAPLNIKKINAQQEKIKVASHSGGTAGNKSSSSKPSANSANLRTDMLKGFTEDEINELLS